MGLKGLSGRRYSSTKLRKFANVCMVGEMFVTLRSCILVSFKLGRFTDSRALFPVVPTEFLKRVHVKSGKRSIIRGLQSGLRPKYCMFGFIVGWTDLSPCFFFFCEILTVLFLMNFSLKLIGLFKREGERVMRHERRETHSLATLRICEFHQSYF